MLSIALETLAFAELPAASVACAANACGPSPVTVALQPAGEPSSVQVSEATPLVASVADAFASYDDERHQPGLPGEPQAITMTGAGATLSMARSNALALGLPAASVAVAVTWCVPSPETIPLQE